METRSRTGLTWTGAKAALFAALAALIISAGAIALNQQTALADTEGSGSSGGNPYVLVNGIQYQKDANSKNLITASRETSSISLYAVDTTGAPLQAGSDITLSSGSWPNSGSSYELANYGISGYRYLYATVAHADGTFEPVDSISYRGGAWYYTPSVQSGGGGQDNEASPAALQSTDTIFLVYMPSSNYSTYEREGAGNHIEVEVDGKVTVKIGGEEVTVPVTVSASDVFTVTATRNGVPFTDFVSAGIATGNGSTENDTFALLGYYPVGKYAGGDYVVYTVTVQKTVDVEVTEDVTMAVPVTLQTSIYYWDFLNNNCPGVKNSETTSDPVEVSADTPLGTTYSSSDKTMTITTVYEGDDGKRYRTVTTITARSSSWYKYEFVSNSSMDFMISGTTVAEALTKGKLAVRKTVLVKNTDATSDKEWVDGSSTDVAVFEFTVQTAGDVTLNGGTDSAVVIPAGTYLYFGTDNEFKYYAVESTDGWVYYTAEGAVIAEGSLPAADEAVDVTAAATTVLTKVPVGKYTITELPKDGYIVSSADGTTASATHVFDYVVKDKYDDDIPIAAFTNKKIPDGFAGLRIHKEASGPLPSGVNAYPDPTVTIKDSSGAVVWTGTLTANGDFVYLVPLLKVGETYTIEETGHGVSGQECNATLSATGASVNGMTFTITEDYNQKLVTVSLENTYAGVPDPITVTLGGTKTLTGRDWVEGDAFTFVIEPCPLDASVPLPKPTTVTLGYADAADAADAATKAFSFGAITFTKPGVYEYHIYEQDSAIDNPPPGMIYSLASYKATVTVVLNDEGELVPSVVYECLMNDAGVELGAAASAVVDVPAFTNTYDLKTTGLGITASKAYTDHGANPLTNGMFSFELQAVGMKSSEAGSTLVETTDIPMPASAVAGSLTTSNVGTTIAFETIEFTEVHAGNTYVYQVTELAGSLPGMTYDPTVYTVEVTVTETPSALLAQVTNVTATRGGETTQVSGPTLEQTVVFENTYTPKPVSVAFAGSKALDGRDLVAGEFEFVLTPIGGAPMPGGEGADASGAGAGASGAGAGASGAQVSNAAGGTFAFPSIEFDAPGTYQYTIAEVAPAADADGMIYDRHVVGVTVTVTEAEADGALIGQLEAVVAYDNTASSNAADAAVTDAAAFTNIYDVPDPVDVTIGGTKTLAGRAWAEGDEFTFAIEPYPATAVVPMPVQSTVTLGYADAADAADAATKAFSFGAITYTEAGTYEYHVFEYDPAMDAALPGMAYSLASYRVTVTVVENEATDELEASVSYALLLDDAGNELGAGVSSAATTAAFTNTYSAADVEFGITASKSYTDHGDNPLVDGMFSFSLQPVGKKSNEAGSTLDETTDIPMPPSTTSGPLTVTNVGTTVAFPHITFSDGDAGFTYVYQVTELAAGQHGMAYDPTVFTVEIMVTKPDAELVISVAKVTATRNGATTEVNGPTLEQTVVFTNTYTPDPVSVAFAGSKTLVGRYLDEGEFEFVLTGAAGAPMPEGAGADASGAGASGAQVSNAANGTFAFPNITFTAPGVYQYTISEVVPGTDAAGITYDRHAVGVTVTVTEGESAGALTGQLVAVVAYDNASSGNEGDAAVTNAAAFTNTYQAAPVEGAPVVAKELVGRDLVAGEFEFELTAGEGSPLIGESGAAEAVAVAVAQNAADGSVTFPSITFTEAGKFEYTISEVAGNAAGITYDSATYTVSAVVTDDGQGQLAVTWQYADGEGDEGAEGAASEGIVFTNTYVPNPVEVGFDVTKLYEGADLTEGQFTFELKDASGKIIQTAKNDAEGLVSFEGLTFAEVGTYVYAVSEVDDGQENVVYDDAVHEVTIVVTDNLEGYLEAKVQMPEDGIEFTNEYDEPDDGGKISQTGDDLMRTIGLLAIAAILGLGVMAHSRSRAANSVVHRR